jgi:hypothetical protein
MTWEEAASDLTTGDKVEFVTEWTIIEGMVIPAATRGTVQANDLGDDVSPMLRINNLHFDNEADAREIREHLAAWGGTVCVCMPIASFAGGDTIEAYIMGEGALWSAECVVQPI